MDAVERIGARLGPYEALTSALLAHVKSDANVRGFCIAGSRAVGTQTENSDLDLLFLADDKQKLEEELSKILTRYVGFVDYKSDERFDLWMCSAGEVGVCILTPPELAEIVGSVTSGDIEGFERVQAIVQHKILSVQVLQDRDGELRDAKSRVAAVPHSLWRDLARLYLSRLDRKLKWWNIRPQWKNQFEEICDVAVILDEIGRCHYAINRKLYMEGQKEYLNDLSSMSPNLASELNTIANITQVPGGEAVRREAARRAIGKLAAAAEAKWPDADGGTNLDTRHEEGRRLEH